jgi:hypothetical protein
MKNCIKTLGILAIASSFALAQDAPKKERGQRNPEAAFKKLDTDGDGSLSLEEFKASPRAKKNETRATEVFGKMDADSNGSVSLDEFKAKASDNGKGGKGKGRKRGAEETPAPPEAPAAE